ncbi:MAG TPA: universal stress protein [Planctomycetota bacterium]|nr:universal stress protein [Planctomycetota bacterium]
MSRFARILCPIDFSQPSEAALAHAEEIARTFGAELLVAHVVEPMIYPVAYGMPPVAPIDYEDAAKTSAAKALEPVVARLAKAGVKASPVVDTGAASMRICELVKERKCDLVVLATHGYTGLKHVLLGSTAERVVRHCSCPVLTVKAPG